jgi:hypothetical protein
MANGKELLQTWFQRVWSQEDATAIEEMFPSPGKAEGLGEHPLVGPEDFKQFHKAICRLLSNINITIDKSVEQGVWISAICTLHATAQADGKDVTLTGSVFCQIKDGKFLESYDHWDFMGLWGQLGYLPSDAFAQGLQGNKVLWPKSGNGAGD